MSIELLDKLIATDWDSGKPGKTGYPRLQFLQGISDIVARPLNNRLTASTSATAVNTNGAVQSTGIGLGPLTPSRFSQFLVKARATFNLNANGALYVYVYRTTGNIPANGAAPNVGDVAVGGDSFAGGSVTANVNQSGSLSFHDTGLNQATPYKYYFAVNGTNGQIANLVNASQMQVGEG